MLNRKRLAALCLGLVFSLFIAACGDPATVSVSDTTAASPVTSSSSATTTATTTSAASATTAAGAGSSAGGATNAIGLPFPPYSGMTDVPIDQKLLDGITVSRRNLNQITQSKSALYTTGGSVDQIFDYYREQAKKLGYVVVSEKNLTKASDKDGVYAKAGSGNNSSIIVLSYFGKIDATSVRIWQTPALKVGDNLVMVIVGTGTLPAVPKP